MEMIQGFRNRVNVISNSVNRGFAAAINQAFQTTDTPYVLVMNPDVRVLPGAVSILEEFMNAHPKAGAAGGHANEKYLPKQFPTVGTLVRENVGLQKIAPLQAKEPTQVEQPAAAAMSKNGGRKPAHAWMNGRAMSARITAQATLSRRPARNARLSVRRTHWESPREIASP